MVFSSLLSNYKVYHGSHKLWKSQEKFFVSSSGKCQGILAQGQVKEFELFQSKVHFRFLKLNLNLR